jgi:hypothetical protein
VPLRLASTVDGTELEMKTLDDRERWLDVFARAAFGSSERRLWVWQPLEPGALPGKVLVDPTRVTLWEPVAPRLGRKLRPLRERVIDRARQRRRITAEVLRIRLGRLRSFLVGADPTDRRTSKVPDLIAIRSRGDEPAKARVETPKERQREHDLLDRLTP